MTRQPSGLLSSRKPRLPSAHSTTYSEETACFSQRFFGGATRELLPQDDATREGGATTGGSTKAIISCSALAGSKLLGFMLVAPEKKNTQKKKKRVFDRRLSTRNPLAALFGRGGGKKVPSPSSRPKPLNTKERSFHPTREEKLF